MPPAYTVMSEDLQMAATHTRATENGKSLHVQGRLCSLSTTLFSSNQSMASIPSSLLFSSNNLHIETNVKIFWLALTITFPRLLQTCPVDFG